MAKPVDVSFALKGDTLPLDHAWPLHVALVGVLPWLEGDDGVAVQTVQGGAPTDHGTLIVTHRAKLVIRVAEDRVAELKPLCGATLDVGGNTLAVGALKTRTLTPFAHIYSHFVALGVAEEPAFVERATAALEKLGIPPQIICGRAQVLSAGDETIRGYSLMLYGLKADHSMLLQEVGLGNHRELGCGIFIPHKSIVAIGERNLAY